jgi:serine/threonine protein kinase
MDPQSLIGKVISERYEILSLAGCGGMGFVYKARHTNLNCLVALKLFSPAGLNRGDFLKRFHREAKLLSLLAHNHIAMFYSYGLLDDEQPYLVMEFVEGRSLTDLLHEHEYGLPFERMLSIALQICDALDHAHRAGIVHRDLKPENIMLMNTPEPDFVKIVDFGLSYIQADMAEGEKPERLTKTGMILGTPLYMSPEQAQGKAADARSDIYALGCILYEMICGEAPFQDTNMLSLVYMHVNQPVPSLALRCRQKLPPGLEEVVLTCLAKLPADRFQSVTDLKNRLSLINDGGGFAPQACLPEAKSSSTLMRFSLAAIAILATVLAGVASWYLSDFGLPTRCRYSIASDCSSKNVLSWVQLSQRFRLNSKTEQSRALLGAITDGLRIHFADDLKIAKFKLQLATELFNHREYQDAFELALATTRDLQAAQNRRALDAFAMAILDGSRKSLDKLASQSWQPENQNAIEFKCEVLLAFNLLVLNRIEEAYAHATGALSILESNRLASPHSWNADYLSLLLSGYDSLLRATNEKFTGAMKLQTFKLALSLSAYSDDPAVRGAEGFIERRKMAAFLFVQSGDLQAARQALKEILSLPGPASTPEIYAWTLARLAVVEEMLGSTALINSLKTAQKPGEEAPFAVRLADAQYWATRFNDAQETLQNALHNLRGDSAEANEDRIRIYRAFAEIYDGQQAYKKEEYYLRKCLSLLSARVHGHYDTAYLQLTRLLDDCLANQGRSAVK